MIRNTTRNQKLGWVLFIAYLTLLVYFMFFAESFGRNPDLREYSYNLELFKEIRRFYKYRKQLGVEAFLLNIVGNSTSEFSSATAVRGVLSADHQSQE